MAKIIEHGKEDKIYRGKIKCPRCDCIFLYTREDIKKYLDENPFNHSQYLYYTYTKCPECNRNILLGGVQNGKTIERDKSVLEVYNENN